MVTPGILRAADLPLRYNAVQVLEHNLARRSDKPALLSAERTLTFLEADDGSDVETGQIGNLWLKGETAALAYLHQYAATRQTFRGEWLRTGDKYHVDEEGYYWHAGRSDDMLKVGGIWVSPVEVESALLAHAAVLECAVVGQADAAGLIKPKAYVVLKDTCPATESLSAELIAFCRARMAEYKRPRWVELVTELPKTATGKIQRFKLRERGTPWSAA